MSKLGRFWNVALLSLECESGILLVYSGKLSENCSVLCWVIPWACVWRSRGALVGQHYCCLVGIPACLILLQICSCPESRADLGNAEWQLGNRCFGVEFWSILVFLLKINKIFVVPLLKLLLKEKWKASWENIPSFPGTQIGPAVPQSLLVAFINNMVDELLVAKMLQVLVSACLGG